MSHNTQMYIYPVGLYNKIKEIPAGTLNFGPKFYFNDFHLKDRVIKLLKIVGASQMLTIGIFL